LPHYFWRHALAEKFGVTPMDIDRWPFHEYQRAVAIMNAIRNAGGFE